MAGAGLGKTAAMNAMVLVLAVGVVLVVAIAVLSYLSAKRRREEMAALAAQRGWTYTERDDRWTTHFEGHPFGTGHDRRAGNVLTGTYDGRGFTGFDYRYSTTSTSTDAQGHTTTHTEVHTFSVIALPVAAAFPELSISPEGFFSRAIGRLTNRDIELESEDFNRAFTVTCPDRKFASDVLHPQMMEYLLTLPHLAWRFTGQHLLVVSAGQHSVPQIESTLQAVDGIVDRIPDFVWQQVGRVDPGRPPASA